MAAKTPAQKRADRAMARRNRRSRVILQKLAREMEITFERLLDGVEDGTVSLEGNELVEG